MHVSLTAKVVDGERASQRQVHVTLSAHVVGGKRGFQRLVYVALTAQVVGGGKKVSAFFTKSGEFITVHVENEVFVYNL